MSRRYRFMGLGLAAVVVIAAVWLAMAKIWASPQLLSVQQAENAVLDQYDGMVKETRLSGDRYKIVLASSGRQYELGVSARDGTIMSIHSLGAAEGSSLLPGTQPSGSPPGGTTTPGKMSPTPSPSSSKTPPTPTPTQSSAPTTKPAAKPSSTTKPKSRAITAEEAKKLAAAHLKGKARDVKRGSRNDYLVEVKLSDGRRAEVQISAISGKVMSVVWDEKHSPPRGSGKKGGHDDDDNDDDDNDDRNDHRHGDDGDKKRGGDDDDD